MLRSSIGVIVALLLVDESTRSLMVLLTHSVCGCRSKHHTIVSSSCLLCEHGSTRELVLVVHAEIRLFGRLLLTLECSRRLNLLDESLALIN